MTDDRDDTGGAPPDTLAELIAATDGLLVTSESDHPFTPFRWDRAEPFAPELLPGYLGLPADAPVEQRDLGRFFAAQSRLYDWSSDDDRARADRFIALRDLIGARLSRPTLYRVGAIQIHALILGHDQSGATVGLRTLLIET